MSFSDFAAALWTFITGAGVLVLALGYAFVLIPRPRAGKPSRPQASERMLSTGRAMHPVDMLNVVAGIWLFISPWLLAAYASGWLTLGNALFEALTAIFALAAMYRLMAIEELISAVLAVWIVVSPRVLQPTSAALAWSNWITAAVVLVTSILSMMRMLRQPSAGLTAHCEGVR